MKPKKPARKKGSFAAEGDEIDSPAAVAEPVLFGLARDNTTVEQHAPVEQFTTGAAPATHVRRARPKPIRRVTDGLTPGQYAVYSLMFQHGGPATDSCYRLYRGGYADLCALTGLSKRGIQNIIAELRQKRVISISQPPGYHRTQTSVYRVPAQEAVVDGWLARGLRFASGKSKTLTSSPTSGVSGPA